MRQFTIPLRMLGAIDVVLSLPGGAGMLGMFRIHHMSQDFMVHPFANVGYMPSCGASWAPSASTGRT